jgi:DNA polymerase-3 subunit delta'
VAGFRTRGQPAALALVARAVASERPPSALLIAGPARAGKTTLALDLAAGLLCLSDDPARRPCRACVACRKLEHGNHPDVHRLAPSGAGGQIRIDQARALISELSLLPLEGRVRIAIIASAQRLNPDAQNALLKTLEEPPAGAVLILCADDETLLLDTVRSRCARVRVGAVAAPTIAQLLLDRGVADASSAAGIARLADGRPGIALAWAASPEVLVHRATLARSLLDLTGAGRRQRLAAGPGLLADAASVAEVVDRPDANAGAGEVAAAPASAVDDEAALAGEGPAVAAGGSTRGSPAARRAAALALIGTWREVARDLVVVLAGGTGLVRDLALLEDYERVAAGLTIEDVAAFLARLDGLAAAIEAYANADLVVDVLLLAWPRTARLAA